MKRTFGLIPLVGTILLAATALSGPSVQESTVVEECGACCDEVCQPCPLPCAESCATDSATPSESSIQS